VPSKELATPSLALDAAFGVVLVGILIGAFRAGLTLQAVQSGPGTVLLGAYMMCWGPLFVGSYFFPRGSFLLMALVWCCEHGRPRGKWTAFLWGAYIFAGGVIMVLVGLR